MRSAYSQKKGSQRTAAGGALLKRTSVRFALQVILHCWRSFLRHGPDYSTTANVQIAPVSRLRGADVRLAAQHLGVTTDNFCYSHSRASSNLTRILNTCDMSHNDILALEPKTKLRADQGQNLPGLLTADCHGGSRIRNRSQSPITCDYGDHARSRAITAITCDYGDLIRAHPRQSAVNFCPR